MSYESNDLGYELGYDFEPVVAARPAKAVQVAYPEQGAVTYRMDPPNIVIPVPNQPAPPPYCDANEKGTVTSVVQIAPGRYKMTGTDCKGKPTSMELNDAQLEALKQAMGAGNVPAVTIPEAKKEDPPANNGNGGGKPAADPVPPAIEGWDVKVSDDKKTWNYSKGGKTVSVNAGSSADEIKEGIKSFEQASSPKPGAPSPGNGLAKVEKNQPKSDAPVVKSNFFVDNAPPEQMPGVQAVLKKFNGNKDESDAYLKLFPYPTAKSRPGLNPQKLKEEQDAWKSNLEKKELNVLRQEMREAEVDRELKEYQKLGIAPDAALSRLEQQGKIDWEENPLEKWPLSSKTPTLKVKDNWDVPRAMKDFDSQKAELEKVPLPKKKDEPNLRAETFVKQGARDYLIRNWSAEMMDKYGWTQEQCDAVLDKMDEKVQLRSLPVDQVAGYLVTGYSEEDKKVLTPRLIEQGIDPESFYATVPVPQDPAKRNKFLVTIKDPDKNVADLKGRYSRVSAGQWLIYYRDSKWDINKAYDDLKSRGIVAKDAPVPKEWPQCKDVTQFRPLPSAPADITPAKVKSSLDELNKLRGKPLSNGFQYKVPMIDGEVIRFDDKLPAGYKAGVSYDPLTQATIEVHQQKVKATPEAKADQGLAPVVKIGSKKGAKHSGNAYPPSIKGKGDKWLQRWDELDEYAGEVTDKAFDEAGLEDGSPKGQGPEAEGAYKLPGASSMHDESDKGLNDALALERNRLRQIGLKDPEIAEYQQIHQGRSQAQVEASAPEGTKVGAIREEMKVYKSALDAEAQRLRTIGLSDAEIQEYQRQHGGRSVEEIGKNMPVADADGVAFPKDQLDKVAVETREAMRSKMVDDVAQALKKMDPNLSDENARLMAEQLYRERTKNVSDDKKANLDTMINARKDVQDDLHLISEKPQERVGKLKSRAAFHETAGYYSDVRALVKGDKDLEKFYGETDAGQENLELYAASRGIDMNDPEQVAKLRKEISKDKLAEFSKTYAEAPKGKPENQARTELKAKYKNSSSGGEGRKKPDLKGMNDKEKSEKEWQLYMQQNQQDYATISEERKHKWEKEDKKEEREFTVRMKKLEYKMQLKQMILQHEMQKEQTLFSSILQLGAQQLNQITQGLNQALQSNLQSMNQMTAQLVLQGAPVSGKDIYLAMVQRGRYA